MKSRLSENEKPELTTKPTNIDGVEPEVTFAPLTVYTSDLDDDDAEVIPPATNGTEIELENSRSPSETRSKRAFISGMPSSHRSKWVGKKVRRAKQNKETFKIGSVGVCLIVCYILLGSLVFQTLQPTYTLDDGSDMDTSFLEALYFSVVCLSTVGFGDITPATPGAKMFVCGYILVFVALVAAINDTSKFIVNLTKEPKTIRGEDDEDDEEEGEEEEEESFQTEPVSSNPTSSANAYLDPKNVHNPVTRDSFPASAERLMCCGMTKEQRILFGSIFSLLIVLFSGVAFFVLVEGMDALDASYLAIVTLTTVGFGDHSPQTNTGKGFTIAYISLGCFALYRAIHAVIGLLVSRQKRKWRRRVERRRQRIRTQIRQTFEEQYINKPIHSDGARTTGIFADESGTNSGRRIVEPASSPVSGTVERAIRTQRAQLSESEFVLAGLEQLGAVSRDTVEALASRYSELENSNFQITRELSNRRSIFDGALEQNTPSTRSSIDDL